MLVNHELGEGNGYPYPLKNGTQLVGARVSSFEVWRKVGPSGTASPGRRARLLLVLARPEDLATNPLDGTQAAFASTGRGSLFPADNWGTLYVVDVDFGDLSASLVIVHDADGLADPDTGIRSPDNIDWADDGKIYAQEDRSTSPSSLFGGSTGIEASRLLIHPSASALLPLPHGGRAPGEAGPRGGRTRAAGKKGPPYSAPVACPLERIVASPSSRLG